MTPPLHRELPREALDYLARRLDGARHLYISAVALGARGGSDTAWDPMGPLIREACIHLATVVEEAQIAGLDTGATARLLVKGRASWLMASGRSHGRLERLLAERAVPERPRHSPMAALLAPRKKVPTWHLMSRASNVRTTGTWKVSRWRSPRGR
jgi:hypothetical protein